MVSVVRKDRPLAWLHGARCHELRVVDEGVAWRIVYRVDPDAIVIAEVFAKRTAKTPAAVLDACRRRLREYDDA